MAKVSVPENETKWFKKGFGSKHEYIGWLQFNDLVDESFGYDDTYKDPFTGKTVYLTKDQESVEQYVIPAPKTQAE